MQSGLSQAVADSRWRRRRLLVLCYHGISMRDEHQWAPALYIAPSTLKRRFELLRNRGCTVLVLGDALARARAGALPDRAVALTFDDGYYNFFSHARGLLDEYRFPATVYLTTLRCAHNFPVVNLTMAYLMWRRRDAALDGRAIPGLEPRLYPLASAADRTCVWGLVKQACSRARLTFRQNDEVGAQVAERLGFDYAAFARTRLLNLMTPEEVRTVGSEGTGIELHTHTHTTPEDPGAFESEVVKNSRLIEEFTGRRARHFCYPSGVYRPSYFPILRRHDVDSAATCDQGLVGPASDPLRLKRFIDSESVPEAQFTAWIDGTAACLTPFRWRRSA